jgi:hypothetical protein
MPYTSHDEENTEEARRDPRSTEQLISEALEYDSTSHDEDEFSYNKPLATLTYRATREVFDAAIEL